MFVSRSGDRERREEKREREDKFLEFPIIIILREREVSRSVLLCSRMDLLLPHLE